MRYFTLIISLLFFSTNTFSQTASGSDVNTISIDSFTIQQQRTQDSMQAAQQRIIQEGAAKNMGEVQKKTADLTDEKRAAENKPITTWILIAAAVLAYIIFAIFRNRKRINTP